MRSVAGSIVTVGMAALLLAGCATGPDLSRSEGQILGGAVGAVAGSQVGGGTATRIAGTAIGGALGAIAGGRITGN